jgi:intracellular septation protein
MMTNPSPRPISGKLKAALEYGPLLVFFAAFYLFRDRTISVAGTDYSGFIVATAIFVPVLVAAMAVQYWITRHLSVMQAVTLVLVLTFGGLTVWLNDPTFFKMKPTLIYLLFAGALGVGLMRGKPWLQAVMGEVLPLTETGWMILTRRFVGLFLGLAIANEIVWRTMSDEVWVNFKTFGLSAIMFVFILAQSGMIARHGLEKDAPKDGPTDGPGPGA